MIIGSVYKYQWNAKSQVETDDLCIAFVVPRGVKWRLSWLSIKSVSTQIFGNKCILTTRDGKKYTFSTTVAQYSELIEEIEKRIVP
jgi:hypothetical protein